MQLDSRVDNLVGSALFADGAAAVIIAQPNSSSQQRALHPRPPLFELHQSSSLIVPKTGDLMAWELGNSGMRIGLGREIPSAIYAAIDAFAVQLMRGSEHAYGVQYADMRWCLHPGGPMIIQAICDRLGLRQDVPGLQQVWSVLRQYGNMSSATLLFVLDEMRKQVSTPQRSAALCPKQPLQRSLTACCLPSESGRRMGAGAGLRSGTQRRRRAAQSLRRTDTKRQQRQRSSGTARVFTLSSCSRPLPLSNSSSCSRRSPQSSQEQHRPAVMSGMDKWQVWDSVFLFSLFRSILLCRFLLSFLFFFFFFFSLFSFLSFFFSSLFSHFFFFSHARG